MIETGEDRRASQDAAADAWLQHRSRTDEAALRLIERAHAFAMPVAALVYLLIGASGVLISIACYVVGAVLTFRIARPGRRLPYLAVLDLVVIFGAVLLDGGLWMPMTIAAIAATSIGWMLPVRTAVALALVSSAGVGVTGVLADADAVVVTTALYALVSVTLAATNSTVYAQRTNSAHRVDDLLASMPVLLWEADVAEARLTYVAGRVDDILGIDPESFAAMSPVEWVHPDDLGKLVIDWSTKVGTDRVEHEIRARGRDGGWVPLRQIIRAVRDGDRLLLRGVSLDITEERRARTAMEQYNDIVERMHDGLLVLRISTGEQALRVLRWNRSMGDLLALRPEDRNRRIHEIMPELSADIRRQLDEAPDKSDDFVGTEIPIRDARGQQRWVDYDLFLLPDSTMALRVSDVTGRKLAQDLLRHQATHDHLTDLPNRVALVEHLDEALLAGRRLGLLLLDLDAFKEINDTLGHHYGDRVLAILAKRFSHLRGVDLVARLGGDEFAFLVDDVHDLTALEQIADRVAGVVEETIRVDDLSLRVGPSIGLALAPEHGQAADVLLQHADIAMYQAKRLGRRHQAYRPADDRHTLDRLALMGELPGLLDRDEIRMWFQPKVDLRTFRVCGVEALIRWQHPREGLLTPDRFIELLEVSGQLTEVTWAVLDHSLASIAAIDRDLPVAVNMPARALHDGNVAQRILDRLALYRIAPSNLHIELTEREIMEDNTTSVRAVLDELYEAGIRISIDDFGTGYSSLSYLRRLPVSEIKIDRAFVSGMLPNDHDYLIARAITDLGHNLGHRIVAEGVEDEATLELLRGIGCDEAQGFLFSRPVPPERLAEVIAGIERRWAEARSLRSTS